MTDTKQLRALREAAQKHGKEYEAMIRRGEGGDAASRGWEFCVIADEILRSAIMLLDKPSEAA